MKPHIASKLPIALELEPGKEYLWCSCGLSKQQPFCDGAHKGTSFEPQVFTVKDRYTVWLCQCKHSKHGHLCDGRHNKLK